ncbi:MAG: nascent polypeptide-associated complex protein [Thermoplasmata archaeon]|nr:nascent polypeptide-associated complex protein [Thermoplasmata archaeon]
MMPGMRGMNPRQMQQAMKKLGIKSEEMKDVEEVIIRMQDRSLVIKKPDVTMMEVQGQKTYQVVGEPEVIEGDVEISTEPIGIVIPEEDIELVAAQANVSYEEAKRALEECNGEPAEAIIKLMS